MMSTKKRLVKAVGAGAFCAFALLLHGAAQCAVLVELLLPCRSALWRLRLLDKLVAFIHAQCHVSTLTVSTNSAASTLAEG